MTQFGLVYCLCCFPIKTCLCISNYEKSRYNRSRDEDRVGVVVAPIVEKMMETRFRWFGHVGL
jgi:hypothetical protein